MSRKSKIIIALHLAFAVISVLIFKLMLAFSMVYPHPPSFNVEREYYLSTLSSLSAVYGDENIEKHESQYRFEADGKGLFVIAESLWDINEDADLEVIHRSLLIERDKGLKEVPSVEYNIWKSTIRDWLIFTFIFYGLSFLVVRILIRLYRWFKAASVDAPKYKIIKRHSRSKSGWNGRA